MYMDPNASVRSNHPIVVQLEWSGKLLFPNITPRIRICSLVIMVKGLLIVYMARQWPKIRTLYSSHGYTHKY